MVVDSFCGDAARGDREVGEFELELVPARVGAGRAAARAGVQRNELAARDAALQQVQEVHAVALGIERALAGGGDDAVDECRRERDVSCEVALGAGVGVRLVVKQTWQPPLVAAGPPWPPGTIVGPTRRRGCSNTIWV
jgi:hypothetical protein